jgi:cytochrome c biogenesis protein CcmG/thiol:disulfide interchange protein DsbE
VALARQNLVPIYGLNYKDKRADALRWLQQFGDPYTASAHDLDGRVGLNYGVYGVPETFLIDKQGVIRYKHIGPVDPDVINNTIMPMVRELQQG